MHTSTKTSLRFARLALVLACGFLLAACEQIIGLEDRKPAEPNGGGGSGGSNSGEDSALCRSYCTDALDNCSQSGGEAYLERQDCLAACAFLPAGSNDTDRNTIMCRAKAAKDAGNAEGAATFCPAAAPGGGSPEAENSCGSNCEAYCQLYDAVCPDDQDDCMDKCVALPDRGTFSAAQDSLGGDTIQCRLYHLNAAARAARAGDREERNLHCDHALLRASLGERDFCDLPDGSTPECSDYCRLVQQACGAHPVYDSQEQCEAVCERGLFPKGTNTVESGLQDSTGDTVACRRWHAYFAFDDMAEKHCPHAGPTGDGHCGATICSTYCSMLERGCKNMFDREFPGASGAMACQTACKGLRGVVDVDMGYDLSAEESRTDTLQCRIAYLVQAMSGMNSCDRAMPRGTCSR